MHPPSGGANIQYPQYHLVLAEFKRAVEISLTLACVRGLSLKKGSLLLSGIIKCRIQSIRLLQVFAIFDIFQYFWKRLVECQGYWPLIKKNRLLYWLLQQNQTASLIYCTGRHTIAGRSNCSCTLAKSLNSEIVRFYLNSAKKLLQLSSLSRVPSSSHSSLILRQDWRLVVLVSAYQNGETTSEISWGSCACRKSGQLEAARTQVFRYLEGVTVWMNTQSLLLSEFRAISCLTRNSHRSLATSKTGRLQRSTFLRCSAVCSILMAMFLWWLAVSNHICFCWKHCPIRQISRQQTCCDAFEKDCSGFMKALMYLTSCSVRWEIASTRGWLSQSGLNRDGPWLQIIMNSCFRRTVWSVRHQWVRSSVTTNTGPSGISSIFVMSETLSKGYSSSKRSCSCSSTGFRFFMRTHTFSPQNWQSALLSSPISCLLDSIEAMCIWMVFRQSQSMKMWGYLASNSLFSDGNLHSWMTCTLGQCGHGSNDSFERSLSRLIRTEGSLPSWMSFRLYRELNGLATKAPFLFQMNIQNWAASDQ